MATIAMAIIVIDTIHICVSIVLLILWLVFVSCSLTRENRFSPFAVTKLQNVESLCQTFFPKKWQLSNFFTLLCLIFLHMDTKKESEVKKPPAPIWFRVSLDALGLVISRVPLQSRCDCLHYRADGQRQQSTRESEPWRCLHSQCGCQYR